MLFFSGFILPGVIFAIVAVGCVFAICVRLALAQTTVKRPFTWTVFSFVLYSVAIIALPHFGRDDTPGLKFSSETEELFYKPGTGEVTYEWTGYD